MIDSLRLCFFHLFRSFLYIYILPMTLLTVIPWALLMGRIGVIERDEVGPI